MVEGNSGVTVKKKNSQNISPMVSQKNCQKEDTIFEHDSHGARVQAKRRRNKVYER